MVFLFPFRGAILHAMVLLPFFQSCMQVKASCLLLLTAGKGLWGPFFSLPSSTTGKYEADPVYVCCNLKKSWYTVVIKEESQAVYPAVSTRAVNLTAPLGPPGRLWRALHCFPRPAPKCKAKVSVAESLHSGNRQDVKCCGFIKNQGLSSLVLTCSLKSVFQRAFLL